MRRIQKALGWKRKTFWLLFAIALSTVSGSRNALAMDAHLSYGGPEGFSCEASSLIDKLSRALPGDSDLATIWLSNDSDYALEAVLSTTNNHEMNRQDSNALLSQVSMRLRDEETVLYEGTLEGDALLEGVVLAQLPAHSSRAITCEIAVPSNLTNEQALAGVTTELLVVGRELPFASSELPKTGEDPLITPLHVGLLCFGGSLAALTGLVVSGRRLL